MIKLYENGVYLVDGKEIVEDAAEARKILVKKGESVPAKGAEQPSA